MSNLWFPLKNRNLGKNIDSQTECKHSQVSFGTLEAYEL